MNTQAPGWKLFIAHIDVLTRLFFEKIVVNVIIWLALIGIVAFLKGGLSLTDAFAVVFGYFAAFMVNFYIQFTRYRDEHPSLKSERAATMGEMVAALRQEYRDMARRQ